ncbi:hypothetical protein LCGC14_1553630, partial [marine sediment metagenome]
VRIYLASPANQLQAAAAHDMPVLISYALRDKHPRPEYLRSFSRLLIDSGAFSELRGTARVDVGQYAEWASTVESADAWAGLDDIGGDWRRSLTNYKHGGFPTIHDSDPIELIDDLVPIARQAGGWIGVGLAPPREGKRDVVRRILDRIPDDLHVHGWALVRYTDLQRIDSVDSTNWWRDAMKLRTMPLLSHLTYAETLAIIVKRYQRWTRKVGAEDDEQGTLWANT